MKVGDLAGTAVELDEVGAFDVAKVGAAAAFVDAQEWLQRFQAAYMDIEIIRKVLASGGADAGAINGGGVAGLE